MLSPSARFSALALPAIVAPAASVAVLGYVSVRQWEASSELLYREQARDMAAMAAEKVEMTLLRAEDAFLDRLQAALRSGTPPGRAVDEVLLRLRRKFEADADRPVWILTHHGHGYKFATV